MAASPEDDSGSPVPVQKHYFVDEAGDGTLFDAKGRVIAGTDGCSSHFILGVLDVSDPAGLSNRLRELRLKILSDPFFSGVESLKPERGKTAVMFHAKDDLPEIGQLVFQLLAQEDVRFHAVVRDKRGLAIDVRNKNQQSAEYRYHPNRLYDEMVKRLFKNLLHKHDAYQVCFARRGSRDRTRALRSALEQARENFRKQWGIASSSPIEVSAADSAKAEGLQAADYFLWAVQRIYTKAEDRFMKSIWPRVGTIHDVDDRRKNVYGAYYGQKNPLTAQCIKKEPGI